MTSTADDPHTPEDNSLRRLTPVLWLSLAAMLVTPYFSTNYLGRATATLLVGGTALLALRVSGARRGVLVAGNAIVALLTMSSVLSREVGPPDNALGAAGTALLCLLLLITPAIVVLRLAQRPRITLDTVAGALAAYIQIGLFFASAFRLVDLTSTGNLFTGIDDPSIMDYQFFSFVTLTTLGYGNLVPAVDTGKSLAMVEAVLGQVFLVTVVAIAVGNLGSKVTEIRHPS
ncbi:MAG: potassium channel family protein [Microthrixaceae bacterium]